VTPTAPVYRLDLTEEEKTVLLSLVNHANLGYFQGETSQIVQMYAAIFNKVQTAPTIASLSPPPSNVVPMIAPVDPPPAATPEEPTV
jgi:hypothetical protein